MNESQRARWNEAIDQAFAKHRRRNTQMQQYIVEFYSTDSELPSDCLPEFFDSIQQAEVAAKTWIADAVEAGSWERRFTIRPSEND